MTECQTCNAKLVTESLAPGQQIRCANCHSFSRFGVVNKIAADRLAWRSLWLGIASIFLLSITGLPAIYYGVRSLLRMRFVRAKRGDQAAAIIGTTLGGCFGVMVGFIVACTLFVILLHALTRSETNNPSDIVAQCDQYFQFHYPDVKPSKATSMLNQQRMFEFADEVNPDPDDPAALPQHLHVTLMYMRKSIQPNEITMLAILKRERLDRDAGSRVHMKSLKWSIGGEPADVTRNIYTRGTINLKSDSSIEETESPEIVVDQESDPKDSLRSEKIEQELLADTREQTHHYFGYVEKGESLYGVSIAFEPDKHPLTETEVEQIFKSIGLVEQK